MKPHDQNKTFAMNIYISKSQRNLYFVSDFTKCFIVKDVCVNIVKM